jgi:hypothetical protein
LAFVWRPRRKGIDACFENFRVYDSRLARAGDARDAVDTLTGFTMICEILHRGRGAGQRLMPTVASHLSDADGWHLRASCGRFW